MTGVCWHRQWFQKKELSCVANNFSLWYLLFQPGSQMLTRESSEAIQIVILYYFGRYEMSLLPTGDYLLLVVKCSVDQKKREQNCLYEMKRIIRTVYQSTFCIYFFFSSKNVCTNKYYKQLGITVLYDPIMENHWSNQVTQYLCLQATSDLGCLLLSGKWTWTDYCGSLA